MLLEKDRPWEVKGVLADGDVKSPHFKVKLHRVRNPKRKIQGKKMHFTLEATENALLFSPLIHSGTSVTQAINI